MSFKDVKTELRGLLSPSGYSKILETNNYFKKTFWLISMIALCYGGIFYVISSVQDYQGYEVVTKIQVIDADKLTFPAVTFCVLQIEFREHFGVRVKKQTNFSDVFIECLFETYNNNCSINDFEYNPIYFVPFASFFPCYSFNTKRNKSYSVNRVGIYTGLVVSLNLSTTEQIYYHVGDNNVRPVFTEFNNIIQKKEDGKFVSIEMKKTVDIKLPIPYTSCSERINSETSHLVKRILYQNIAYRQKNCFDLCFNIYLTEYALTNNLTKAVAYLKLEFDYIGNCSHVCPLECSSTSFEIFGCESRSNLNVLLMNFYYSEQKYTEITQIEKTTMADLVSNAGGVLGLFLELSFLSICRWIIYVFNIIF